GQRTGSGHDHGGDQRTERRQDDVEPQQGEDRVEHDRDEAPHARWFDREADDDCGDDPDQEGDDADGPGETAVPLGLGRMRFTTTHQPPLPLRPDSTSVDAAGPVTSPDRAGRPATSTRRVSTSDPPPRAGRTYSAFPYGTALSRRREAV